MSDLWLRQTDQKEMSEQLSILATSIAHTKGLSFDAAAAAARIESREQHPGGHGAVHNNWAGSYKSERRKIRGLW